MSWQASYRSKLKTAGDALACVQSGTRVYIQPGCGEPEALVGALLKRAPHVSAATPEKIAQVVTRAVKFKTKGK